MNWSVPIQVGRRFLFLQGPPGPFFYELAMALKPHVGGVYRINLSGGDKHDWPGQAADYRGTIKNWPLYVDNFICRHGITDIVLFGDCRPVHHLAALLARLRGIHIHVFEEGYIRPDWMTLERDGVNGFSLFERDPLTLLSIAGALPDLPNLPPITAAFRRRARDSFQHYRAVVFGRLLLRYPFYRSHRQGSIILEGIGWLKRWALRKWKERKATEALTKIEGQPFVLFPMQLSGDYQIRAHSPFTSMAMAVEYVIASFARYAPRDMVLLIKEHPLDVSLGSWPRTIARLAMKYGVRSRVMHIDGGDLGELCEAARGMVCVNSTSGTLALAAGTPVIVLGEAVYDIAGITHQGSLDGFWMNPQRPKPELYEAFRKVLHRDCLVRGGLASASAVATLVENSLVRLLAPPERVGRKFSRKINAERH